MRSWPFEKPRTVEVKYRGASVRVVVAGAWEEFNVRLDVYLKEITNQSKSKVKAVALSTPSFCEEDLVPTGALVVREIEQAIYSRYNNCRVGANEQLSKSRQLISEHVLQFLDDNEEVLCMVDPSFCVEANWFRHMAKQGCQELLKALILDEFPGAAGYGDAKDTASHIEQLKNGPSYLFADRNSQSDVNIVAEWVKAVACSLPSSLCRSTCS